MRLDLHNNIVARQALNAQTIGTSTTTAGAIIDTEGFHSLEFILSLGTVTDGTYTMLVQESDNSDMSDPDTVGAENLFGTIAAAVLSTSNSISRLGVRLAKRYVRLSVVSATVTTGSTSVHAIAILGTPNKAPTA